MASRQQYQADKYSLGFDRNILRKYPELVECYELPLEMPVQQYDYYLQ